jgi:hypothetical protein
MVGRKPEDWRILTPIFTMISPIIVGAMSWFLINIYNVQQATNLRVMSRIDIFIEKQDSINMSLQEKLAQVRYQCCSEQSATFPRTYQTSEVNGSTTNTSTQ